MTEKVIQHHVRFVLLVVAYEVLVFFVLLNPKAHSPEYFA